MIFLVPNPPKKISMCLSRRMSGKTHANVCRCQVKPPHNFFHIGYHYILVTALYLSQTFSWRFSHMCWFPHSFFSHHSSASNTQMVLAWSQLCLAPLLRLSLLTVLFSHQSAVQDFDEGFAKLDVKSGVYDRIDSAVQISQPGDSAVQWRRDATAPAMCLQHMSEEER